MTVTIADVQRAIEQVGKTWQQNGWGDRDAAIALVKAYAQAEVEQALAAKRTWKTIAESRWATVVACLRAGGYTEKQILDEAQTAEDIALHDLEHLGSAYRLQVEIAALPDDGEGLPPDMLERLQGFTHSSTLHKTAQLVQALDARQGLSPAGIWALKAIAGVELERNK